MADDFTRNRDSERFEFLGMKLNDAPDTLPPGKYPLAINVRGVSGHSVQTRGGFVTLFSTTTVTITDIRAYTALFTDDLPRLLVRDAADNVFLDTVPRTLVGVLAGGGVSPGAAMIPFRPNASPTPWMYVANGTDYQKFSAPSSTNVVTKQKVGIAEPQAAPTAAVNGIAFQPIGGVYVNGGTAAAGTQFPSGRVNDTSGVVFQDQASTAVPVWSVQVGTASAYQRFMEVIIGGTGYIVQDVFPPLPTPITIAAILYFAGTTGHCIIVPNNLASAGDDEQSIYAQTVISVLRRGTILNIGGDFCLVWSVTEGPNGTVSIETSTAVNHGVGQTITGVPVIQVMLSPGQSLAPSSGSSITASSFGYSVTLGVGTQTAPLAFNPFVLSGGAFQPDDYLSFGVNIGTLANLVEMKILIDVGDGTFTGNFYYYTARPSDILGAISNGSTQLATVQTLDQRATIDQENAAAANNQLQSASSAQTVPGNNQWSQLLIPLSSFTRVGGDLSKSLQNANSIQILWNVSGTTGVVTDYIGQVIGQSQPDVGDVGAPYRYRARPRSTLTGVVGNPSPATRYGISARREGILVTLPSAAYDPQIDTWDVFRYGGSVTEWRFIGSTPITNNKFLDNFDDSAANGGDALDFDNFEPWPSVDVPNNGIVGVGGICGTVGVLFSPLDTDITNYLPGTLIQFAGGNSYTLQVRPVGIGAGSYLVQFIENAGVYPVSTAYSIQEPFLANQMLPYMWGPDASGTVFACGDSFRPGTVYFAKNYAPDSAPDSFNQEISQPAEPLLGGETIDGLAFVGSPERWWALYPQPQDAAQRYAVVQQPYVRGLAAPFGHCNDGRRLFWWAKDGIYSSEDGSLTDDDLHTLFPHEGVAGQTYTYNGNVIPPPDYSRAGTFRLAYANGFLYAIYQDSTAAYHTLVCYLPRKAWCIDTYNAFPLGVSTVYHPEQQAGTLQSSTKRYPELIVGTAGQPTPSFVLGIVASQQDLTNDGGGNPITCTLATREMDGGDARAPKQWGDFFVDVTPASQYAPAPGLTVQPMSLGAPVAAATVIPSSATRQRVPVSVGGTVVSDFMGLYFSWFDDFRFQSTWTKLRIWQPSYVIQPPYAIAWTTFGTSFGMPGYFHIRQLELAYVSTTPITLTITSYDGQSPLPITLPSSAGQYVKTLFPISANKGQLFKIAASSAAKFQIFLEDSEIYVGAWGRSSAYAMPQNFGGSVVQPSSI